MNLPFLLVSVCCTVNSAAANEFEMPMRAAEAVTLVHAWLAKLVRATRPLGNIERPPVGPL